MKIKSESVKNNSHVLALANKKTKKCILCREQFHASTKYSLFCEECKIHNERYRYAEWLGDSEVLSF